MNEHLRVQQLAVGALDFAPSPADERVVATHVRDCASCRRAIAGYRADGDLARSLPGVHAPDRVRTVVVAAATRPAPRSGAKRFVPLVGAAVVVLAVLIGIGWLARSRTEGPAQLPPRTWTVLGDVPAFANGTVSDVIGTGAQLIAVGEIAQGGHQSAAVWMSADGLAWQPLPADASFADAAALNVAASGGALIVLGASEATPTGTEPATVRAWRTTGQRSCDSCSAPPSGDAWQTATIAVPSTGGAAPLLSAVTAVGNGFALVGTEVRQPVTGDPPVGAIVATSADGLTWTFSDPADPAFAGSSMRGVAAGPTGLVAVGETALAPTVWTSADGRSWTRITGAIPATGATLRSVAAGPAGYVAVGDEGGAAAAWVSADGRSWQPAPASTALAGARMERVSWLGTEFVAIGERGGDGIAWSSPDGLAWTALDTGSILDGTQLWAAAAIGSRTLLFGVDGSNHPVTVVGEAPAQQ